MKSIKIPKVGNDCWVYILKSKTEKFRFYLPKQEIEGLVIPKDSSIDVETDLCERNSSGDMAEIPAYRINRLLRYVYMDNLRKGKN